MSSLHNVREFRWPKKLSILVENCLEMGATSVAQWIKKNQKDNPAAFVELDVETQAILKTVSSKYPDWTSKGRNQADPFVVAMAKAKGWMVVTGEHPSSSLALARPRKQHKLKIPNVCDEFTVEWIGIPDFIKEENWSF